MGEAKRRKRLREAFRTVYREGSGVMQMEVYIAAAGGAQAWHEPCTAMDHRCPDLQMAQSDRASSSSCPTGVAQLSGEPP
jgi:hypothetical protein